MNSINIWTEHSSELLVQLNNIESSLRYTTHESSVLLWSSLFADLDFTFYVENVLIPSSNLTIPSEFKELLSFNRHVGQQTLNLLKDQQPITLGVAFKIYFYTSFNPEILLFQNQNLYNSLVSNQYIVPLQESMVLTPHNLRENLIKEITTPNPPINIFTNENPRNLRDAEELLEMARCDITLGIRRSIVRSYDEEIELLNQN